MKLRQIELFRAIMQTGSFTSAAEALHISQPGVSRAARHLEIQLGVPLFERAQGRIRPTAEALALHAEIERSFRGVQSIQQFAHSLKHGAHAVLRVACSPNIGVAVVPDGIAALLEQQPGAAVSLEVLPRAQQQTDVLLAEQVDLVFSAIAMEHPMFETLPIGHWDMVCLFPADHPLAQKKWITPRDVAGEPLVAFQPDTLQGRVTEEWLQDQARRPSVRAWVRSGQTAASLVASGVGITFVDGLTAIASQASNGLAWRPMKKVPRFPIEAVWNRRHAPSQQAMRLCELVRQELRRLTRAG